MLDSRFWNGEIGNPTLTCHQPSQTLFQSHFSHFTDTGYSAIVLEYNNVLTSLFDVATACCSGLRVNYVAGKGGRRSWLPRVTKVNEESPVYRFLLHWISYKDSYLHCLQSLTEALLGINSCPSGLAWCQWYVGPTSWDWLNSPFAQCHCQEWYSDVLLSI